MIQPKSMSQPNAKQEVTLEIESLSYGPYGVARLDGQVVLIPGTAPGDKVAARIVETKSHYAIAEITQVIHPSRNRRLPPCPYVAECGGCPWQQVHYEAQLQGKQKSVEDALRRIGKLDGFELRPIISSPNEFGYRRRIRLQVGENKRLGFYRAESHQIAEIDTCLVAAKEAAACIPALRCWLSNLATPIETIEVATGDEPSETVIIDKSPASFLSSDEAVCAGLLEREPYIRGLILLGREWRHTWGDTKISLNTGDDIRLVIEADVFTQVNADGNRSILTELLNTASFSSTDRVLELYCGGGNFTLSIAKRAGEVVAVEGHRPAIQSGKLSAQLNSVLNIRWVNAPVAAAVKRLASQREKFSNIVLDPPRAGAKGFESELASLGAGKILYVSCDPATFARDASALAKHGYKLAVVQPVDLFPQTFHVEVIATFIH
jgi:23S rRNA (uracil1939-C5)-methyltransferase